MRPYAYRDAKRHACWASRWALAAGMLTRNKDRATTSAGQEGVACMYTLPLRDPYVTSHDLCPLFRFRFPCRMYACLHRGRSDFLSERCRKHVSGRVGCTSEKNQDEELTRVEQAIINSFSHDGSKMHILQWCFIAIEPEDADTSRGRNKDCTSNEAKKIAQFNISYTLKVHLKNTTAESHLGEANVLKLTVGGRKPLNDRNKHQKLRRKPRAYKSIRDSLACMAIVMLNIDPHRTTAATLNLSNPIRASISPSLAQPSLFTSPVHSYYQQPFMIRSVRSPRGRCP
ncbi:hypothetical protein CLF_102741 [Clonorchis sinensis]|uniref:Uncharacterized protein n=1 Tax=Clonorchis sinensis TaxID=79923 RepID=G7YN67_CLOSI|nr:hypothetical protein CLF_102741 [Clonorchis sinensis]